MDGKGSKTGMSIESDVIQYNDIGLGGRNGKGEVEIRLGGGGKDIYIGIYRRCTIGRRRR